MPYILDTNNINLSSDNEEQNMEHIVNLHIEKLPEGVYLATSEELQGLVVQGRTVTETLAIAQDVAKQLLAAQAERQVMKSGITRTQTVIRPFPTIQATCLKVLYEPYSNKPEFP